MGQEWTREQLEALSDEELAQVHAQAKARQRDPLAELKERDPVRYERLYASAERELAAADQRSIDHFAKKVAARDAELADQSQATRGERQLTSYRNAWQNFMGGRR